MYCDYLKMYLVTVKQNGYLKFFNIFQFFTIHTNKLERLHKKKHVT